MRGFLMAIGILMMTLSGVCTMGFGISFIRANQGSGLAFLVLLFGGVPFAIGFLIFYFARKPSSATEKTLRKDL